ncbi:MAG: ribonuclease P protein component, partial [Haliscomenobacter sp.]
MPGFGFPKSERLKSRKEIGTLFKSGSSIGVYPLRAVWKVGQDIEKMGALQVAVSVPKKKFRRAVDRNRLRRQVRESYRLRRGQLNMQVIPPVSLMILY